MPSRLFRPAGLALSVAVVVLTATFAAPPITASEAVELRAITLPIAPDRVDDVYWTDTFGAPRGGGRSHIGVDMMGEKMIPLVAARSGVVTWGRLDNARGSIIRIQDDDGWEYVYIHLNNDTPGTDDGAATCTQVFSPRLCDAVESDGDLRRGTPVTEGEVIGYMGDGGNAESTRAHLHFEVHRPAGDDTTPVNPTPSVDQARQRVLDGTAGRTSPPPVAAPGEAGFADHVWYRVRGRYPTAAERSAFDAEAASAGVWAALASVLDGSGAAPAIDRLYLAFFGRYPDGDGLGYWMAERSEGHDLEDIADWFAESEEFQLRYGGVDFGVFLDRLYVDVLGRSPDPAGRDYWLAELEAGRVGRGTIVVYFTESDELQALTARRSELVALIMVHQGTAPSPADVDAWDQARSTWSLADALYWWYQTR